MSSNKKSKSSGENVFLYDFLMGGTAAAISKTAAAPIERVKLLIRNQGAMIAAGRLNSPYRGITDCFKTTFAEEGLASFWRGNGTNVLSYFPTQALHFAFKDDFKQRFGYKKSAGFAFWDSGNIASGAAAGASFAVFVYSLDYKWQDGKNAAKGGQRQFAGLINIYRQTIRTDGILGLYRGFIPSILGVCEYRCKLFIFGGYDTVRDTLLVENLKGNFLVSFAVGWACTTGASLASYPLDTIRRWMMMASGEKAIQYTSFIDAGKHIIAKEGVKALFNGAGANILRGVATAGALSLYDKFQELP
ncbi:hypothetical protein PAXRUDRAFT_30942 [Paxillus rubicundulus Ve08.2h10]|uniref:ADP/ATP translocase n=1 Tax=Paxillus rubicundulus Ve08.2h10 TaxID=930991 RepID=A0A0D0EC53_9AGAM|nr:hypothetical protein PAXRUDRAFT_30942 [Paxillus rubicundulus Ve08.2h10]